MDEKIERRRKHMRDMWVSVISIFIAGMLIYPPSSKYNYWPEYPDYYHFGPIEIAENETIALIIILSIILGGAIATVEDIRLPGFISGGVIAYIVGMYAFESVYSPSDSPVHFILYGGILIFLIIGAALTILITRKDFLQRVFGKLFAIDRS